MTFDDLKKVQARRNFPTRATQRLQLTVQNVVIAKTLEKTSALKPPLALRVFNSLPFLSRIPARLIGLGFRPEYVSDAIRAGTGA